MNGRQLIGIGVMLVLAGAAIVAAVLEPDDPPSAERPAVSADRSRDRQGASLPRPEDVDAILNDARRAASQRAENEEDFGSGSDARAAVDKPDPQTPAPQPQPEPSAVAKPAPDDAAPKAEVEKAQRDDAKARAADADDKTAPGDKPAPRSEVVENTTRPAKTMAERAGAASDDTATPRAESDESAGAKAGLQATADGAPKTDRARVEGGEQTEPSATAGAEMPKPGPQVGDLPPQSAKPEDEPAATDESARRDGAGATSSGAADDKPAADIQVAALPPQTAEPKPEPEATAAPPLPLFDVAEVGLDGMAVVAGKAAPGARVRLVAGDGDVLAEAVAGEDGAFAMLPEQALPLGDSALRLEAIGPDGAVAVGEETIVVSRDDRGPALVVLQSDDATRPSRVLQQPESPVAVALTQPALAQPENDAADAAAPPTAPETPETSADAVKSSDDALTVKSIDYDAQGRIAVQGEAPPGAEVTVEVDGAAVARTTADKDGAWSATSKAGAAEGAERVGAAISGASDERPLRVSLPFAPASLIRDFPRGRMVVVQPGNSLWRIARRTYGAGIRYTVIYAANRGQIRDPDLIYPGQILHAPKPPASPREG